MSELVLFDVPGPRTRRRMVVVNVLAALLVAGLGAWVLVLLGRKGQLEPALWQPFLTERTWTSYLLPGLRDTLRAAGLAIVASAVFGLLFGLGRLSGSRVVRWVSGTVVEFFRAVPVLLMMIFFYSGISQLRVVEPQDVPLLAVVLALMLYNGSVFAELVRSGVHNLPRGQREAALAVGLRPAQSLRLVEVPQALIAMLPAIASQLVVILKDTALGAIITYPELLDAARRFGSGNGNIMQALLVAAVVFIVINYGLTTLAQRLASRVGRHTAGAAPAEAPSLVVAPGGADR
ncbi:amino acid ABC transporter permease [Cellulomonas dongxiuzhuiae]|uniref:Amino acid ABC transporter permease n=1 Tax=Cellulomonas dongxiuzhuiae TaxID=2819979 RepID=A0ABX8GMJ4_9CELL|nr:amino acid ABC transporter permease [Cellulomonas dongxiuzhuiae]MBO3087494.1 amino acid ABC transporter permease [Cellulomonas dongxiuzhuiae]MBO3096147.1 amino acid ABC transporter permease [Cellulomonas dongxiuzhuiae]QWC17414.1 amino acid ABC transporter permease [Cellulomonas dongxiuzhuiae]